MHAKVPRKLNSQLATIASTKGEPDQCSCGHPSEAHALVYVPKGTRGECLAAKWTPHASYPCPCRQFDPLNRETTSEMFPTARMSVRSQIVWIDGAKITVRNDDGWLQITAETANEMKGFAITINDKHLP
jgi:hypothetical protein